MGNGYEVYGWTYGDRLGLNKDEWYYKELYRGESLIVALWTVFRCKRQYGCVKLEVRDEPK
jgi:hypothetical protein